MQELKHWSPFLAVLFLLAVALIIRHPLIEQMALVALVVVTLIYAVATDRMSRATAKLAEVSAKTYDPDLVVYSKDWYPSYGEHPVPGNRGERLHSVRWRIVLDNPGLVPILVTGFRLEIAGLDSNTWKSVNARFWKAIEKSGQVIVVGEPFRVDPRATGIELHIFLCTQDVPELLSEVGGQTEVFKLKTHFEYKSLGWSERQHTRRTSIASGEFLVLKNAEFGKITII